MLELPPIIESRPVIQAKPVAPARRRRSPWVIVGIVVGSFALFFFLMVALVIGSVSMLIAQIRAQEREHREQAAAQQKVRIERALRSVEPITSLQEARRLLEEGDDVDLGRVMVWMEMYDFSEAPFTREYFALGEALLNHPAYHNEEERREGKALAERWKERALAAQAEINLARQARQEQAREASAAAWSKLGDAALRASQALQEEAKKHQPADATGPDSRRLTDSWGRTIGDSGLQDRNLSGSEYLEQSRRSQLESRERMDALLRESRERMDAMRRDSEERARQRKAFNEEFLRRSREESEAARRRYGLP